jgi:hypothetical protein
MAADDEEAGEYYIDALTGKRRRRRGKRKRRMGQYSLAEKNMVRAFQKLMAAMHHMDGELADLTAQEFTKWFAFAKVTCERYSYENLPDPVPEDWQELRMELDMDRTEVRTERKVQTEYRVVMVEPGDDDGLDGLRLLARVGVRTNNSILPASTSPKNLLTIWKTANSSGETAGNCPQMPLEYRPIATQILGK